MQRYFVDCINNNLILKESDFHHIKDVMRIKDNGEIICVFNNQSYLCKIHYVNDGYEISIVSNVTKDVELPKRIHLYQALIKNDKFDLVVQKATELGVSDIHPTIFSRSIVKISNDNEESKLARYYKICKEACEQSHRQVIPNIHHFIKVCDIFHGEKTLKIVAYEKKEDDNLFYRTLEKINDYEDVAVVIGPEGGFEKSEIEELEKNGFICVSLGKRILRSETASLYVLSIIAHYLERK
ncbi:MAG: 16S rRNA (uracil(1498)-N(3))-methyltransferase [Erysipelotrichaceae bacterium]|nr:16S rRNA (uracil(1498)-N(3))-methyltransferase [Erysipelotrichaceae bacterium]